MAVIPLHRPAPSINVGGAVNLPELTQAPANAVKGLGSALSSLGADLVEIQKVKEARAEQKNVFSAEQSWLQFQNRMGEEYVRRQAQIPADGTGWHDSWQKYYDEERTKFVAGLPTPKLQEEYGQRSLTASTDWSQKSAVDQLNQTNKWFRVGITDAVRDLQTKIRQGGGVGFEDFRAAGEKLINSSSLPPLEKQELLQKWRSDAAIARIEGIAARDPQAAVDELNAWLKPDAATQTQATGAGTILRREEGFRSTAYWDVNAWRIGYGSDTVTRAGGKREKVTKDTVVTRADAERDLNRRIGEFTAHAASQVGQDAWNALPANVRSGLVSVAYNYGSLPSSVVKAVRSGNVEAIASAVEALNANPARRRREAAIIRGSAINPLADVAPNDLDKVASGVQAEVNRQRAEDNRIATEGRQDLLKVGEDLVRNMPGETNHDPSKPFLTEKWLQDNRENLSPSDYRYFVKALDREGDASIKTPPHEMLRLDDLVHDDPRAARPELRKQFAAGLINWGTYNQLDARAQAIINGEEKRPYIGQIRSYLTQQIRPDADASSSEYATSLQQMFAFDDWAASNKEATREDAQVEANRIIAARRAYRIQALRLTLPIPRFMDAPSRWIIGPDQVGEAIVRTGDALGRRQITPAEAAEQTKLLESWREVVNAPNQLNVR